MGKAVLIYGNTHKDRVEALKNQGILHGNPEKEPDLLVIEKSEGKKSIGIEASRSIKKFLKEKPLSKDKKTVVVTKAEIMTPDAQNALLKIIEEPPSYAEIYLLSKTENSLLETVVSRCIKKRATSAAAEDTEEREKPEIVEILKMDAGERLDKAKILSEMEKEELTTEMEKWVTDLRISGTPGSQVIKQIEIVLKVKKTLEETNVNQRLALEALLLNL